MCVSVCGCCHAFVRACVRAWITGVPAVVIGKLMMFEIGGGSKNHPKRNDVLCGRLQRVNVVNVTWAVIVLTLHWGSCVAAIPPGECRRRRRRRRSDWQVLGLGRPRGFHRAPRGVHPPAGEGVQLLQGESCGRSLERSGPYLVSGKCSRHHC